MLIGVKMARFEEKSRDLRRISTHHFLTLSRYVCFPLPLSAHTFPFTLSENMLPLSTQTMVGERAHSF